jgi:hypothetical protein
MSTNLKLDSVLDNNPNYHRPQKHVNYLIRQDTSGSPSEQKQVHKNFSHDKAAIKPAVWGKFQTLIPTGLHRFFQRKLQLLVGQLIVLSRGMMQQKKVRKWYQKRVMLTNDVSSWK